MKTKEFRELRNKIIHLIYENNKVSMKAAATISDEEASILCKEIAQNDNTMLDLFDEIEDMIEKSN